MLDVSDVMVVELENAMHDIENMLKSIATLERELDAKQAKIDELMLEYCPDEITDEQWDEYRKHQVTVSDDVWNTSHQQLDLTDDEIADAVGSPLDEVYLADFRAVIAAYKEKNK